MSERASERAPESIKPIRAATHAGRSWRPSTGFGFAAASLIAPIAGEEMAQAATHYALAFMEGEHKTMVALLGLRPQQNLYVGPDARWLGDYIPAVMRGYPFKLLAADGDQFALGYDESSGLLAGEGEAEPFFTADGQPAERVQKILKFLIGVHHGIEATTRAGAQLAAHGLLEPWPLTVRDGETEIPVKGLLRVSEAKMSALADDAFIALRHGGILAVAYAQLLSMTNMTALGKLAQLHARHAAMADKRQAELQSMFEPIQAEEEIDWAAMLQDDKGEG